MKLLLDECVDRRLAREIHGHEVSTVSGLGWSGARNGELLARVAGQFDAFVTVDRNLAFQQPIDKLPFAVLVLRAPTKSARRPSASHAVIATRLAASASGRGTLG